MAPLRTAQHADASSVQEHQIGTSVKNPKVRPHKRTSTRPKWFRSVRPVGVSDVQFVTQSRPSTTRKVSIEELQQSEQQHANEEASPLDTWSCFPESSVVSPSVNPTKSRSVQTLVSPTTSPRLLPRSASCTPASMKRRAPSMCLVGLLAHQTEKRAVVTPSSLDDSVGSSGVWGHFVELQQEEQHSTNTLLDDSSPRRRPRRPILRGPHSNEKLEGFFLTLPDVDEAVDQLRNMSF